MDVQAALCRSWLFIFSSEGSVVFGHRDSVMIQQHCMSHVMKKTALCICADREVVEISLLSPLFYQ